MKTQSNKWLNLNIFVAYDGYFISPKGFLPTVVDIMVISIKFAHLIWSILVR